MKKLIALFFVAFSICAHAAKLPDFKGIGQTKTGNSVSLGPTGNINPTAPVFDSRIPVRNINLGGEWQPAGNYGAARDALRPSNAQLRANGEVFFPGTRYPFQAGYVVPPSLIVTALSALCSNPIACVLLTVGTPYLLDWLGQSGVSIDPQSGEVRKSDPSVCTVAPCFEYETAYHPSRWFPSQNASCAAAVAAWGASLNQGAGIKGPFTSTVEDNVCYGNAFFSYDNTPALKNYSSAINSRSAPPSPSNSIPASMDDISPYMDKPMDPRIFKELLDKGANIELPLPTITGPASTDGEEVTTINPDGSKTVSKTKYNFQTSGNTVTNTDKSTTTTTFNIDNSVRNVSTTTTVPSPSAPNEKEEKDPCKENPESAGCAELDTPEGEIPKTNKEITFTAQTPFGGGSCPADKFQTLHTGQTLKVVDWATPCGYIADYVRPVLILLGSWMAMMLLIPGRTES